MAAGSEKLHSVSRSNIGNLESYLRTISMLARRSMNQTRRNFASNS